MYLLKSIHLIRYYNMNIEYALFSKLLNFNLSERIRKGYLKLKMVLNVCVIAICVWNIVFRLRYSRVNLINTYFRQKNFVFFWGVSIKCVIILFTIPNLSLIYICITETFKPKF